MKGCSKLEVLPIKVNLKSLDRLVLSSCSSLKSFPEISQNIESLDLSGSAIEMVPSFIWSCSRLEKLDMSYCKNLKEFSHALDNITERDTKRQKVSPFAENCESLERLDCSFPIPYISLNFANCFKLNKEARDLIIQPSTNQVTVLPVGDMSTYFTYRANGCSLVVKLNERSFCSTLIFKVCIMLVSKKNDDVEAGNDTTGSASDAHNAWSSRVLDRNQRPGGQSVDVNCGIMDKQHRLRVLPLTDHLYIFEVESGVTSNELSFEIVIRSDKWVIKECGVNYKRCIKEKSAVGWTM